MLKQNSGKGLGKASLRKPELFCYCPTLERLVIYFQYKIMNDDCNQRQYGNQDFS